MEKISCLGRKCYRWITTSIIYFLVKKSEVTAELVTQIFLHWNQIQASLRQWKTILEPEANSSSIHTTIGY